MKFSYSPLLTALLAVSVGALVSGPAYPASTQDNAASSPAPAQQQSNMADQTGKITSQDNKPDVCARLDRDHNGQISLKEFKASGKPSSVFKLADTKHRGWLDQEQCTKALKG